MKNFSALFLEKFPNFYFILVYVAAALASSENQEQTKPDQISFDLVCDRSNLLQIKKYLLSKTDICQNTVSNYLAKIRVVLIEAAARNLAILPADISKLLNLAQIRKHGVFVDVDRLKQLENLSIPENTRTDAAKGMQIARNLFLISARTGARAVDVARLKQTNVRNGRLTYVPQKTKGSSGAFCVVPIGPRTEALINDTRQLLADTDLSTPRAEKTFYTRYERSLKALMQLTDWTEEVTIFERNEETVKPFRDAVTTHTARHSFATNMYLDEQVGGDIYAIAQMLGHSSVDMTMSYICVPYNEKKMAAVKYFE